ncbi:MAG: acetylglutamate kinase [Bacteroidota bacterium]|nr:acetylglutamate kinase [Bacteroidota bacterium]MDP4225075.1 acetylglutamate kinase [Bacteroidota bacterium]MDP4273066.1 acetylglutamate kinase [Bacteroidota bacterium]
MEKLTVVKVGGKVVEDPASLEKLLSDFSKIEGKKILIHGGGKTASNISEKLGITPKMVDGRRITDAETLKVVVMTYAGLVNKTIVAALQALGCNATGLSGADLNCIVSTKREVKEIDYGFVGDIKKVNAALLSKLLDMNVIPVMAPITHDGKGQLLNTNADTIATRVAIAMAPFFETNLILCFEKKGVLSNNDNDDSVIPSLTHEYFEELKSKKVIKEGMIPKLDNGFAAIRQGVKKVIITNFNSLSEQNISGTELV